MSPWQFKRNATRHPGDLRGGMKFLLVHPPMDGAEPPARRTENLGLAYIAAVLRRDGHDVEMLDGFLRRMKPRQLIEEILRREFDCLGITAYDVHKKILIQIARDVRKHRKDAIICAGGYFPTFWAEKLLPACPELDFVVRGEGEWVVSEVFGRMSRGEEWRDVPGIAYLKDGSPVLNPMPPLIADLDSIPFAARDEFGRLPHGDPALVLSSRGCYHRCSFCSISSFYGLSGTHAPRSRDPKLVVDELEHLVETIGIREFVFADDNFIGPGAKNRERVMRFVEELKARKLDIRFTIECRVDEVDESLLRALMEVGLFRVFMGLESGVQTQLDRYSKRITIDQSREAVKLIRSLGLETHFGFITLDPYVTLDEMLTNLEFVRELKLSEAKSAITWDFMRKLGIYGGMPLAEKLRADGLLRERGFDLTFRFKNPGFRLVYGAIWALAAPARWLGFLRIHIGNAFTSSRLR